MRLACLSLLLLSTAWLSSIALDHDGGETPVISATKGGLDNGDELETMDAVISTKNGGRNLLATHKVMMMMKLEKGSGIDSVGAAASKELGGKCDGEVMKGSKVKCKNNPNGGHFSVEDAGFEVFSKDYHLPSHHPPKNN